MIAAASSLLFSVRVSCRSVSSSDVIFLLLCLIYYALVLVEILHRQFSYIWSFPENADACKLSPFLDFNWGSRIRCYLCKWHHHHSIIWQTQGFCFCMETAIWSLLCLQMDDLQSVLCPSNLFVWMEESCFAYYLASYILRLFIAYNSFMWLDSIVMCVWRWTGSITMLTVF